MENNVKLSRRQLRAIENVVVENDISESMLEFMHKHGIDEDSLSQSIRSGYITLQTQEIHGLCVRNMRGGYSFFSDEFFEEPVTLINDSFITLRSNEDKRSKNCCLFWNFLDYLAFRSLQIFITDNSINFNEDCIIIAGSQNFVTAMLESENYYKTFMFLPNTDIGRIMSLTINAPEPTPCRNFYNSKDMSFIYRNHNSMYDYLQYITKMSNLNP